MISYRDKIICAKCRKPLAGVGEVRLQPRPKLTAHMQKLLQKRRKNENSLTERQQELLKRSMQQCNILVGITLMKKKEKKEIGCNSQCVHVCV